MAQFMKLLVIIALTFTITTAIITTTATRTNPTTETFALKDPFKDLTHPGTVKTRPNRFSARNAAVRPNQDSDTCGSTGAKCRYLETCCGGQCVYLNFDNRNCGECNHRCLPGVVCIYGLCAYA